MPPLANARHERFAQELAKGKTATEAYEAAGYAPSRQHASRLATNGNIAARVAELQERGARRAEVTVESLVNELEQARTLAERISQPAAMVSASFSKARLLGLVVEKREDVTPRRSLEQINARIAQLLERGGGDGTAGAPRGEGAGSQGDEALPTVPGHGTA